MISNGLYSPLLIAVLVVHILDYGHAFVVDASLYFKYKLAMAAPDDDCVFIDRYDQPLLVRLTMELVYYDLLVYFLGLINDIDDLVLVRHRPDLVLL